MSWTLLAAVFYWQTTSLVLDYQTALHWIPPIYKNSGGTLSLLATIYTEFCDLSELSGTSSCTSPELEINVKSMLNWPWKKGLDQTITSAPMHSLYFATNHWCAKINLPQCLALVFALKYLQLPIFCCCIVLFAACKNYLIYKVGGCVICPCTIHTLPGYSELVLGILNYRPTGLNGHQSTIDLSGSIIFVFKSHSGVFCVQLYALYRYAHKSHSITIEGKI